MMDKTSRRRFPQDRRQSAVEVVVTDRSEADSKIKGGAGGRLVLGPRQCHAQFGAPAIG